jgi:hypothetical protein
VRRTEIPRSFLILQALWACELADEEDRASGLTLSSPSVTALQPTVIRESLRLQSGDAAVYALLESDSQSARCNERNTAATAEVGSQVSGGDACSKGVAEKC